MIKLEKIKLLSLKSQQQETKSLEENEVGFLNFFFFFPQGQEEHAQALLHTKW